MKKQFLILFAFISVLTLSQVPQRFNKVIVTGDITSPKFIRTGSTADSVLLGNGSARAISTVKTDTVSLSNRINAKATGSGIAYGTNTGDETLTSIKTKLGAASAVSDGYLTSNMFNVLNNSEPSFTKRTAFNKNFGTTTGTVLEGRTFGTAAGSAVGDFQPIENQRLSTTNAPTFGRLQLNTTGRNEGIAIRMTSGSAEAGLFYTEGLVAGTSNGIRVLAGTNSSDRALNIRSQAGSSLLQLDGTGAATFSSTVNSTGFLLNGNNLTSSLTTNYIPKWNGSSMVNSLISDDGNRTLIAKVVQLNDNYQIQWGNSTSMIYGNGVNGTINLTGNIRVDNATPSTLPTSGALIVGGGMGADHVRANNFYGNGSNLTGVQLPITLTTNGTSGAATFENGVMNVPNYGGGATTGTYTATLTLLSGLASSFSNTAFYTKIGSVYHTSLSGGLTTNATGNCTFKITLPSTATSSSKVCVIHIYGNSGSYIAHSFVSTSSPTDVTIGFTSTSASGSSFSYNIMVDYY